VPLASDSLLTTSSSRPGVVPPGLVENAVKILEKVIGNIIGTPEEEKFRKLKKTNKMVEGKLLPCRGAVQLLTAVGFRNVDGVLILAAERLDVAVLAYALERLGALEGEKEAAAVGAAAAAEQARIDMYKKFQEDKEEDKRAKLAERGKLDEQREEFARRAASDSAPWEAPAVSAPPAGGAAAAADASLEAPEVGGAPMDLDAAAAAPAGAPLAAEDVSEGDRVIYRGAEGPEVVNVVSVTFPGLEEGEDPIVVVRMTSGATRDTVLSKLERRPA